MKFHFGLFERTDDAGSLTPLRTTISKLIKAEMAFFFRVVGQILSEGMWGSVNDMWSTISTFASFRRTIPTQIFTVR